MKTILNVLHSATIRSLAFKSGTAVAGIGLGRRRAGQSAAERARQVGAVRDAFALGDRVASTAAMYGDGGAGYALGLTPADAFSVHASMRPCAKAFSSSARSTHEHKSGSRGGRLRTKFSAARPLFH